MIKNIFVFICLISPFISIYRPMKKDSKVGKHICRYLDHDSGYFYVKPCGGGQYCVGSTYDNLGVCQNVEDRITPKIIGEECKSDFECDSNLYCNKISDTSSKCGFSCNDENKIYKTDSGIYVCEQNKYAKDFIYFRNCTYEPTVNRANNTSYSMSPPWTKKYGKISFNISEPEAGKGKVYTVTSIEPASIGSLDDGEYVFDGETCKSGYALFFYPDGNLNDTYTGTNTNYKNNMYKRCVTVKSIDKEGVDYCKIKYSIGGGEEYIYNVDQLRLYNRETINNRVNPVSISYSDLCENYLMTKLEMFKNYVGAMSDDMRTKCESPENYKDSITCNNNELTKWWYFYNYPQIYLTYYDKDDIDVSTYLIQQSYQYYQSSQFLNSKYFISLLFLLFL